MSVVDVNCDLGESFGVYRLEVDDQVYRYISSVNIACGYHAGDHNVMQTSVERAQAYQVNIGAHPGLPDRMGFGRRYMDMEAREVYNLVVYQIGALQAFIHLHGGRLHHVKPHGALYHMGAHNSTIAEAIAKAVYDLDTSLVLYALAGSVLVERGRKLGLTVAEEVFADRTYQSDGSLTPRSQKNALITSSTEAIEQIITCLRTGTMRTVTGTSIHLQADTICVHGDSPQALGFLQELYNGLRAEGIRIGM
ncbi:LamB/YcsF family protein [Mechercharimyces sp. CAU 1602]|nr:5-oxoprolinase subunit PxpA [Mechercharimyces sp. CAU 1602]MCS1352121.1 LamB/YcsF family protein [Mechercharimyces sp. CAU 1602]